MNVEEVRKQAAALQWQYKLEQSTALFQQAYALYEQEENWAQAADCLIQQVCNKLNEYSKLGKRLDKELEHEIRNNQIYILQKLGKEHLFNDYMQLRLAQFYLGIGEWECAEEMGKKLLDKLLPVLQHGHRCIKDIFTLIMRCQKYKPDKQEQLDCLQENVALFLRKESLYRKELVLVYQELAMYYIYIDSAKSLAFLEKGLTIAQQLEEKDRLLIQILHSNLGHVNYERGDNEKALLYFQKALSIALELNLNSSSIVKYYANISNCYSRKKLHKQSIWHCEKAIEYAHQLYNDQWSGFALLYSNYGACFNKIKAYQDALNAFHKGLQIYEGLERKDPVLKDYIYLSIEETYRDKEDYQQSVNYLKKIIEGTVFKSKRDLKSNITVLMNMGLNYSLMKAYDQSLNYLQQALQMDEGGFKETNKYINPNIDEIQLIPLITKAICTKGYVFSDLLLNTSNWSFEDVQMSLFCVQFGEILVQKIYDSLSLEESKTNLGEIQTRTQIYVINNLVTAIPFIQKDPAAFKRASSSIMQLNAAHTNPTTFPYITNETQCKEQAFTYSEQFKARVLLENLQANEAILNANLPTYIVDKEASLKKEMIKLHKQVRQAESKLLTVTKEEQEKYIQQIAKLQSEQLDKHEEYEQIKKQLTEFHPVYSQNKEIEKIVSITELQQVLLPHQLLLSYFVLEEEEGIVIFSVQKHCLDIHKVEMHQNKEKLVKKLLKSVNQLRYTKFVQLARDLYQLLLAPVLDNIGTDVISELIIIPHQYLSYIPFECLLSSEVTASEETSYANLPYLIQSYQVNYHYSASLFYHQLQKEKQQQEDSFIGFAPVYNQQATSSASNKSSTHLAPQELEAITASSRSIRIGGQNYEALIYSEQEITDVEEIFTNKAKNAQSFLHENATVEQFKKSVQHKKYIHIAAHGFETKAESGLTGIVFSPQETDDHQEDAVLFLPDMYTLKLDADLVVLSSCKSGIGRLQGGEGMMAMNRGFLAAGAQNVVYTLFKIYDQASSEFVKYFFEQIVMHQKSYKEALQMAKQYMIQKEGFTPKHWAGFVLIGQ